MFDRFTDPSRMVMGYARQEAQRLGHDYIGSEHILLGLLLLNDEQYLGYRVLLDLGASPEELRRDAEDAVGRGDHFATTGQLPFTPRAKTVLEGALEESQSLRHDYIGTGHILVGLIRSEGIAAEVLVKHGIGLDATRKAVADLADREPGWEKTGHRGKPPAGALQRMRGLAHTRVRAIQRGTALVLLPESGRSADLWERAVKPALEENDIPSAAVRSASDPGKAQEAAESSEVVIADLSGRDPEVCFELGRSIGLGRSTLLLAREASELPPALKEHPVLLYEDGPEGLAVLATRLADTIRGFLVASRGETG